MMLLLVQAPRKEAGAQLSDAGFICMPFGCLTYANSTHVCEILGSTSKVAIHICCGC